MWLIQICILTNIVYCLKKINVINFIYNIVYCLKKINVINYYIDKIICSSLTYPIGFLHTLPLFYNILTVLLYIMFFAATCMCTKKLTRVVCGSAVVQLLWG